MFTRLGIVFSVSSACYLTGGNIERAARLGPLGSAHSVFVAQRVSWKAGYGHAEVMVFCTLHVHLATPPRSILSVGAQQAQQSLVFASVFVIVWAGAAVVTANAQLLGGNM